MKEPFDENEADAPATPEELAQAEALALGLEGRGAGPASELETVALLRQARGAEVPDVRAQVVPALAARRPRRWWLLPTVLVPATAALVMMGAVTMRAREPATMTKGGPSPSLVPAPTPPLPTVALLQAQAKAAQGDRRALAALASEMRRYRSAFYRSAGGR